MHLRQSSVRAGVIITWAIPIYILYTVLYCILYRLQVKALSTPKDTIKTQNKN